MPTSADAGSRFGEVGGIATYVEDHVASDVFYCGVGVRGGVVDYPEGVGVRFLCAFCLLHGDGTKGGEHGWANRDGIIEERPHDLLH